VALPQVLLSALRGEIQAIVSVRLPLEYESVLTRPHQLEATGLSIAEANAILDALTRVAEPVHLRFLWRPRLEDPADEMVLEIAVKWPLRIEL
jgi:predicted nucleic acid-binding protein